MSAAGDTSRSADVPICGLSTGGGARTEVSLGVDGLSIATSGGLARHADHRSDGDPWVPLMSGANHCVAEVPVGLGASQEGISNVAQRCGVSKFVGLCLLEAGGEFMSLRGRSADVP